MTGDAGQTGLREREGGGAQCVTRRDDLKRRGIRDHERGPVVAVRATDSSIEQRPFGSWQGCDTVGALFQCTVTLTGNHTVTATLSPEVGP